MQPPTPAQRRPLGEVAASEGRRLASDPNILCVGFGLRFAQGRPTMEAVLQYHVRAKADSAAELQALRTTPVPRDVEGYRTDVIQVAIGRKIACPDENKPTGDRGGSKEDPLVGGTSTTVLGDFHSLPTGYGTLGGICFDGTTGEAQALSNAHVYGDAIGSVGIQPWLPISEYLEGGVKYLLCGGPLSHVIFWTAPSDLTTLLSMGAAAAWCAAAASDAEDPSRWGQRTGPIPAPGVLTDRERVHIEAEVPRLPFPGRDWSAKTRWDYMRNTTAGSTSASIAEERPNEHVLVGKRAFTDRDVYHPGDRVTICADLWTPRGVEPTEHFVVAHCFPIAERDRSTRRVLVPGRLCERIDRELDQRRTPVCVHGFTPQVSGVAQMNFPVVAPPFVMWSGVDQTELQDSALRIPRSAAINIACPPSTHIELEVAHKARRLRAVALGANGREIDHAQSPDAPGEYRLNLTGPEIVRISVEGGEGEGYLAGICADKRTIPADRWKAVSRYYTGTLDLGLRERPGRWAVVIVAQTLDATPTGGDPVAAARRLGGIVDSANLVETGECACTILFDHTFEVAEAAPGPLIL